MKDKKLLVIINEIYPFENGETFLGTELSFVNGFDRVIVFPCSVSDFEKARPVPAGVDVVPVPRTKSLFVKMLRYIRALFLKSTLKEIIYLIKKRNLNCSTLKKLLSFVSNGMSSYKFIAGYIEKNCKTYNKIIFYSYWMHFHAFCAVKLRNKFQGRAFCVSRCHGFDLYEYRDKNNYIPLRNYIIKNLNAIYCISKDGEKYLASKYPGLNDNIKISRLGTIDCGIQRTDPSRKPLKIVSCSWVSSVKRVKRIAEALSAIKGIDIEWTHFGDGGLYDEIKDYCDKNLAGNIKFNFPGAVPNNELMEIYSKSTFDIFVNVSESEGVPVSIMEAESFGIPVIATDVGGTNETVKDGENGFLLNKDFEDQNLVGLIIKFAEMNDGEYLKFRQRSRELWKTCYSAQNNYREFYKNLSGLV